MFKLVIQDDEGKTTVVPLIRDEITIGRKEGNTIRLTERNVSRRHARIVRANGAVAIEDLGSYNGVRVNGTRIAQRTSLSVSDRVQIGDYLIELKAEGVEQVSDDGKTQPIERMDPNFIESQIGTAATMPPSAGAPGVGPPGVVALADTDPAARAISAMATAPIGSVGGHARMVVLSSNFAGQEWELARPQMIVGRTDDNDIVVNHRSISRNHAKIIREADTGRYTISDLQSSNGVRVNGEEYGKVELRRGDIVDLGHVRLRFVEPGEDFVFGRDAQIADVPTGGKSRGLMIAAAVVLLGVGAVAVVMLTRGGGDKTKPTPGSGTNAGIGPGTDAIKTGSGTGAGTGAVMVATPDAAAAVPGSDIAAKLAECRGLRDAEDWIHLLDCGKAMLTIDPKNPDAPGLIEQAKREQATQLTVTDLDTAIRSKDPQAITGAFKKIGSDSIYYEKAQKAFDQAKADILKEEVAKAKTIASHHDCKTNDRRADQVGRLWDDPAAGDAIRQVVCHEAGGGSGGPPPPTGCKADNDCSGGKVCKSGACVAGPPPPACDATVLLDDARAAGSANQWSKMLQKAEASNKCSPAKIARQLSLLAACHLGNKDKALKYWPEFQSNAGMRQACIAVIGP